MPQPTKRIFWCNKPQKATDEETHGPVIQKKVSFCQMRVNGIPTNSGQGALPFGKKKKARKVLPPRKDSTRLMRNIP